jgi:transposase
MEHLGLDLGAVHTHVVEMSSTGQIRARTIVRTAELAAWLRLRAPSRVVMEACTQSPAIARAAKAAKHETFVVPGQLVRALGVGARGIKTDHRDAEVLARASVRSETLPTVHLRNEASRARLELLAARALLVRARSRTSLHIKTWLRARLVRVQGRASTKHFADAVRRIASTQLEGLPMATEILLQEFESLSDRIAVLDEQLDVHAKNDPTCALLMTMPGVGPVCASMLVSHVDEISRFESAEQLVSFLGLVPGEATTGGKVLRTSTIKAGPKYLRALLVQSAWSMMRARPNDPATLWARAIAERHGKYGSRIAVVALARKMASVLYAMWKKSSPYDPARASMVRAARTT